MTTQEPRDSFYPVARGAMVICAVGAILYGVASIIVVLVNTEALTFPSWSEFIAGYSTLPTLAILTPPFVVALAFPVVAVGVYRVAPSEGQPFALLAVVFAGVYTAVLGMAYWLQLTFVPQSISEGNTDGLAMWVLWHPRSFFWAFESFGYFAMGASSFLMALALPIGSTSRVARVALGALGPLGLVFMLNEALGNASPGPLSIGLVFVWVGITAVGMAALARSRRDLARPAVVAGHRFIPT